MKAEKTPAPVGGRSTLLALLASQCLVANAIQAATIDLTRASVVVRPGALPAAETMAARVLVEEVAKRTGLNWSVGTNWPAQGAVIAIASGATETAWPSARTITRTRTSPSTLPLPEHRQEGFRLVVEAGDTQAPVVWIQGADSRGALFGTGELLRRLEWAKGKACLASGFDIATAPAHPIRGHQLGYRHTANSYDGWDERQFEQYIRELALFGANSIEGIPFQDERTSPHMPLPRNVMNRKLSDICARYEMAYWLWVPANFDLQDTVKRTQHLDQHEALFRDCTRLDALFFPGGDPGDNPPKVVIPFLEDLSRLLLKYHPRAKIWLSMQGFEKPAVDFVHAWINESQPNWLGGLVAGPSSPPLPETRARLPQRYGLRDYPDITHTVRCQFPVAWWDPAFALTLGRESANPRPLFYKVIQNYFGPYTSGAISYSDGVHDDVNKAVWSRLGWQPDTPAAPNPARLRALLLRDRRRRAGRGRHPRLGEKLGRFTGRQWRGGCHSDTLAAA